MTSLTLYATNATSTTLSSAGKAANATGGTETTADMGMGSSPGSGYIELRPKGAFSNQDTPVGSIPSPTGNGVLWDVTTLEGQTINAGNWSGSIAVKCGTSISGATITVRFYKRSSGGTYTSIGSITSSSGTIATSRTAFSLPATSMSSVSFATGDKLYYDIWANATWSSFADVFLYLSSTSTGVAGDGEIDTPGYGSGTTANKDTTSRFRLMSASQLKDVASRLRLRSADQLKDTATRFRQMSAGQNKDTSTRFRLATSNQFKDVVSRFLLRSANQVKDLATRFPLVLGTNKKDVAARLRLRSSNQLKDLVLRLLFKDHYDGPASMPIISRNVPAYTNDSNGGVYPASNANDSDYTSIWRTQDIASTTPPNVAYLAYDLSGVSSSQRKKVMVVWYNNATGDYDYTINGGVYNEARDYTIDANAASGGTLPSSGWVNLVTVTGNVYHSRQHVVDLTGYNWVRIYCTATNGGTSNTGCSLNMDIHDLTHGIQDDFIIFGDSITAGGLNVDSGPDSSNPIGSLAQLINYATHGVNFPIIESGGIGGRTSSDGASHINTWLANFPGKYVGLAYGTNDANGGVSAATYKSNMQTMITAILAQGCTPIISHIPWSANTTVQSNAPALNTAIDQLIASNPGCIAGPDLWTFFSNNQSLISGDNIHPTAAGYTALRQQWALALEATIYQTSWSDIAARFRLMSANQTKDIPARLRLRSADQTKDLSVRFRLTSSTQQLKDIVARLRLISASQARDIASRLRLMSASQLRDMSARLRLMSANQLRDITFRLRIMSASQLRDVATRLRLMSPAQLRDIATRLRVMSSSQLKDVSTRLRLALFKDISARFRLMSANQLKDIAFRLRLMSANQLKDLASRLRLMSASQREDIAARLRLAILKDLASRLRLMSANQLKDLSTRFVLALSSQRNKDIFTRFVLRSANQSKDILIRFRLRSPDQAKDIAARLRLMSANQLHDLATRLLLRSANQQRDMSARLRLMATMLKDISTRLRLRSADHSLDLASRLRLMSSLQLKDISTRLRLGSSGLQKDILSRFRLRSATQSKDLVARFLLSVLQAKDVHTRLRLRSADVLKDVSTRLLLMSSKQVRDLAALFVLGVSTSSLKDTATRFVLGSSTIPVAWITRDNNVIWITRDNNVTWRSRG